MLTIVCIKQLALHKSAARYLMDRSTPAPCFTRCGGHWTPRLSWLQHRVHATIYDFNNAGKKHGACDVVSMVVVLVCRASHICYVSVYLLQHSNNSNIHNSPSCPSVVETTNKERNKQQNPRIAGSQSVLLSSHWTESCMCLLWKL